MNTSFELVLHIGTPIIMKHKTTLDGLLAAALYNQTGLPIDETMDVLPLAREQGIFKASCVVFDHVSYLEQTRIRALRSFHSDIGTHLFSPNGGGKKNPKYVFIDTARDRYINDLTTYAAISAPVARFYGVGDPDKVVQLIKDYVPGLGARAKTGAGQITDAYWHPSPDFSWMNEAGLPMRPIPVDVWESLPDRSPKALVAPMVCHPPYWLAENAVLAVFAR